MPEVKLLLEEKLGNGPPVRLDLFGNTLTLDDTTDPPTVAAGAATLSTAHFSVTFNAGTGFPAINKDGEVLATIRLRGSRLTQLPGIEVKLDIRRESKTLATIRQVLAWKQSVTFDWKILKVQPCVAELTLGEKPVRLTLLPEEGMLAATFELLGAQFEFDKPLIFSADGVRGKCQASSQTRARLAAQLQTLLKDAVTVRDVTEASAEVLDDAWTVHLLAGFRIPFFVDGDGELEITATRREDARWAIESTVRLANARRWGDPQGWFQIEKPSLDLRLYAEGDSYRTAMRLGGKITFLPAAAERLGKVIADWFGDLFEGMTTEFDSDFRGDLPTIALRPFAPFRLRALEMFELRVPRIDLGWTGQKVHFDLKGIDLRLDIGDVGLRGTLPPVSFDPFSGSLTVGGAGTLSVDLALSAPGGVKGSAKVEYVDTPALRYLQGRGQLSTPTFPGVAVAFRVGQFRVPPDDRWIPTVLLYADAPAKIPLFPLVIVQQLGLGVGVNCEIQGTSRLTLAEARRRVQQGLPDVSDPNVWTPSRDTALTLLARLFLGPTGKNEVPGFYAADMTLIVTSEAQAAAFGKLWLYTSINDARTADFQQRPAGLALMMLDAQEPALRIAAQTTGNGLTSIKSEGLAGQLMGFSLPPMRLAFEATRNGIALYLGPNQMSGSLGPLRVQATSLLAFRARFDGEMSYAMSRSSLSAGFDWGASASVGPVSLSASFSAGFAVDLLMLGSFGHGELTVYGSASIAMNAALSLHASVGFRITIDCWFDTYTISWSVDYDFRMEVHVDLSLEAALTTGSEGFGLRGHATASVSVLGISVALTVPLTINTGAVDTGRKRYAEIDADMRQLLGI